MSGFVIPAMVKRVEFVNLVPDGSFEDVANNWNVWLADPTDASQAKDGARSLRLGGDALAATRTAVVPINGHKYYGREYIKTAGQLDAADCRFEMVGAVNGVEKAFIFGWNRGNYPNWTVNSGIATIDGSYTDGFGIRTFTVGGTVSAWVDSIVVIDLTEACGAGNEPSKEWCDANIPFFNGSYEMSVPVTSPVQALVAGLTIPDGVVTQIDDAAGNVIWKLETNKPVILEVEKITSDTYAGETAYTGEQFILLDIYPKTNGTVNVTYGGLTKTITDTSGAAEPNSQQVFFGTFNGVSDSVATPASGELTIEGDYYGFMTGKFQYGSKSLNLKNCGCIVSVTDFGNIRELSSNAFQGCTKLTSIVIPGYMTKIPLSCFSGCTNLVEISLPNSITSIDAQAFYGCTSLALTSLPSGVTSIGHRAFDTCASINITTFPEGLISIGSEAFFMETPNGTAMSNGTIILPSTLQSIDSSAFCTNERSDTDSSNIYGYLNTVRILATTPPTIQNEVFGQDSYLTSIIVPAGCVETYKAADVWGEYGSYLVEAS